MVMGQLLKKIASKFDLDRYKTLHEEMSFDEYLNKLEENPLLARTSFQRIYDMIMSFGSYEFEEYKEILTHYNFFDTKIPIHGIQKPLNKLVEFIRGAARGHGTEKRFLLLHGPVGSAKSTIARRLKRGLEEYTRTDEGAIYTYKWIKLPKEIYTTPEDICPLYQDPIKLTPPEKREELLNNLNEILIDKTPEEKRNTMYRLTCDGEINPRCQIFMDELLELYDGDWEKVVSEHIRVIRFVFSESARRGIGTFQPKDEKNQDSTELTGDVLWNKLSHFGNDSDARTFDFKGEFCISDRGMLEFIEVLKLAVEFLYDLLGATQEKQIKPKKLPQISIDEFLIGHTNSHEYKKLSVNESMGALRDRTVKIDIPYLLRWSDEIKVLEQDYGPGRVKQHVAPHTLEIAALWAVLTRLKDDSEGKVDLLKKAKLYNGQSLPGISGEDAVMELMARAEEEGMSGVSCRYVQDKISNCLSSRHDYINPFMVMNEIREGLYSHSLINKKEDIARYDTCAEIAMKELDEILKNEVRKALTGDEKAIERLCANYIDNVMAYIKKAKVRNTFTKRDEPPNERLMRSIEEKIEIPSSSINDFRRTIAAFIGDMANENKKFRWDSNEELKIALEAKLFEDTKDHIKLSALHISGASTVQPDLQEKIDAIKKRLIDQNGYNEQSATDVLEYVGSIYARIDADSGSN